MRLNFNVKDVLLSPKCLEWLKCTKDQHFGHFLMAMKELRDEHAYYHANYDNKEIRVKLESKLDKATRLLLGVQLYADADAGDLVTYHCAITYGGLNLRYSVESGDGIHEYYISMKYIDDQLAGMQAIVNEAIESSVIR